MLAPHPPCSWLVLAFRNEIDEVVVLLMKRRLDTAAEVGEVGGGNAHIHQGLGGCWVLWKWERWGDKIARIGQGLGGGWLLWKGRRWGANMQRPGVGWGLGAGIGSCRRFLQRHLLAPWPFERRIQHLSKRHAKKFPGAGSCRGMRGATTTFESYNQLYIYI